MLRMQIVLDDDEARALSKCARQERRAIRQQAAVLIRRELQRLGLLPAEGETADA